MNKRTIRTILIDDEPSFSEALKIMLERYSPKIEIIAISEAVEEAIEAIELLSPDLIFLDVNMSPHSGFDVLAKFPERNFEVVFCTAYDDYAIPALRNDAFDYLIKPLRPSDLIAVLNRLHTHFEKKQEKKEAEIPFARELVDSRLVVPTQQELLFLSLEDIVYIQADSSYSHFKLKDQTKITSTKNLGYYEELFGKSRFIRPHNSYIVNLDYIDKVVKADGSLLLKNGEIIPMAFRRKEELMEYLKKFM